MLFHHALENALASPNLHVTIYHVFLRRVPGNFSYAIFPSLAGNLNRSMSRAKSWEWLPLPAFIWLLIATTRLLVTADGKGLPEMIVPKKYRPSWSMIYKCEYIYIYIIYTYWYLTFVWCIHVLQYRKVAVLPKHMPRHHASKNWLWIFTIEH